MYEMDFGLQTPEQVELEYDVAGLGSRFTACMIDSTLQAAVMLAVVMVAGFAAGVTGWIGQRLLRSLDSWVLALFLGAIVLLLFLILWGYFLFFEIVWNGQSPGKRMLGIRVMSTGGEPITVAQSLVRNLVRLVDFLPSSYVVGAACVLLTRHSQRLGDLAAGTMVVRVHREESPRVVPTPAQLLPPQAVRLLTTEDVALAREFVLRRHDLTAERRRELLAQLATRWRAQLGATLTTVSDEELAIQVAAAER
ncbi:MAG: RDD family protein [Chloroflexota bacterium]